MAPIVSQYALMIGGSDVVESRRKADELAGRGIEILDFGVGEPDFGVPPPVQEAAIRAIRDGHSQYIDPRGLSELREVIAESETRLHGLSVTPERIIVSAGSFGVFSLASRALFSPGDEVLILEPYWGPYRNMVKLTGAVPKVVPLANRQGRFVVEPELLAEAVTEKTRAIIVNSPNNPTGRVYGREELEAIAALALKHDLWILSDEVYSELIFDGSKHTSIATLGPDVASRTVVVNSLSKTSALTGWRLGYAIVPPELAQVFARINHYTMRCAASIVQYAAVAAFTEGAPFVAAMRDEYQRRRDLIVRGLNAIPGVSCPVPEGTFYAFPEIAATYGTSKELTARLLEEAGVIVTAGSSYGTVCPQHMRFSFATSAETIERGLERVSAFFSKIDGGKGTGV